VTSKTKVRALHSSRVARWIFEKIAQNVSQRIFSQNKTIPFSI
jgi:hypothetical protein